MKAIRLLSLVLAWRWVACHRLPVPRSPMSLSFFLAAGFWSFIRLGELGSANLAQ